MWLAKNESGQVTLYYKKPKWKEGGYFLSQDAKYFHVNEKIPNQLGIKRLRCGEMVEVELKLS